MSDNPEFVFLHARDIYKNFDAERLFSNDFEDLGQLQDPQTEEWFAVFREIPHNEDLKRILLMREDMLARLVAFCDDQGTPAMLAPRDLMMRSILNDLLRELSKKFNHALQDIRIAEAQNAAVLPCAYQKDFNLLRQNKDFGDELEPPDLS